MRLLSIAALGIFFAGCFFVCCSCVGQGNDSFSPERSSTANPKAQSRPGQFATPRNPGMSKTSWQNELIRRKLDEPANFHFEETPWVEIEEEFEKKYRFNIILDDSAKDDSLDQDEPFTVELTGIPLRNSLRLMLKPKNATYIIQDGVLKIVSLDDVEDSNHFTTAFIDVRALLAIVAEREKNRIFASRNNQQPSTVEIAPVAGKQVSAKNGQSDDATPSPKTTKQSTEPITAESLLLDLIQKSYRPHQWERSGQGLATIDIIGGNAVVSCNETMADGLRDFLKDLHYNVSRD